MTRIALPALIVIVVVAGYVATAGWNQSGEPSLIITLTERELQLPFAPATPDANGALRLWIDHQSRHDPLDTRNWLPESRLREIGFPFQVPVGAPQAADAYARVPPRTAWIVFEYDGPQWREIQRRRELQEPSRPGAYQPWSRLVPVDAAADFDALRARYPTGHLILHGVIGLTYLPASEGGPLLYGTLREVVPRNVAVPKRLRSVFEGLERVEDRPTEPRYEAELAIGRLGFPYLRSARRIE